MAALAERRIIPHDELKSRKERKDSEAAEPRPEHLRLLEALLFAASVPLDEKTLGARLPEDVDLRQTLRALQAEYAPRGVNLVKVGNQVGVPHRQRSVLAPHQGSGDPEEAVARRDRDAVGDRVPSAGDPRRGRGDPRRRRCPRARSTC